MDVPDEAGGEVCAEEALLDAGPEGEGDDEELEGLLHVLVRRLEELHARQLLTPLVAVELAVPGCEVSGMRVLTWTDNHCDVLHYVAPAVRQI